METSYIKLSEFNLPEYNPNVTLSLFTEKKSLKSENKQFQGKMKSLVQKLNGDCLDVDVAKSLYFDCLGLSVEDRRVLDDIGMLRQLAIAFRVKDVKFKVYIGYTLQLFIQDGQFHAEQLRKYEFCPMLMTCLKENIGNKDVQELLVVCVSLSYWLGTRNSKAKEELQQLGLLRILERLQEDYFQNDSLQEVVRFAKDLYSQKGKESIDEIIEKIQTKPLSDLSFHAKTPSRLQTTTIQPRKSDSVSTPEPRNEIPLQQPSPLGLNFGVTPSKTPIKLNLDISLDDTPSPKETPIKEPSPKRLSPKAT